MATEQSQGSKTKLGARAYRVWSFLAEYSVLLLLGAVVALIWANIDNHSYHHLVEYPLWFNDVIGIDIKKWVAAYGAEEAAHFTYSSTRVLTVHYLINDMLMALFFAIAGKEVWEAVVLKDGSLRGRKALTPLVATAGGILGPIAVYFFIAAILNQTTQLANGWAIPIATDIAFSYLVGRLVFGAGHPAVRFLLLLAIADDAIGLVILAIFFPQGDLAPEWLLLSFGAAALVYFVFNYLPRRKDMKDGRKLRGPKVLNSFGAWPYIIGGCVSWFGFSQAGIHPALGLLPIIPAIPHADNAQGFFAEAECYMTDMLNKLEHALKTPVEVILLFFGLANAGVVVSMDNTAGFGATLAVLGGLLIGKPLGIWLLGVLAANGLKLGLPEGMKNSDLVVLGMIAAIGFTVSLFIAALAFPGETEAEKLIRDGAKLGALLSFFAAGLAILLGRIYRVEKVNV